jgi:hypothetical protein
MKRPFAIWLLVFALFVLALGGLAGAYGFLSDPTGTGMGMADVLDSLPLPDFRLPGLFLLIGMFVFPLTIIYGLLARPQWEFAASLSGWSRSYWAWAASLVLGLALALWLTVQGLLIGFSAPIQWFTAVLDAAILALTLAPSTRAFYAEA